MTFNIYTAAENRRSHYSISKESPITDEKIQEIVEHAVKYTPSAFNSQSARVVVLLGEKHDQLWDITKERLRVEVGEGDFTGTEQKLNSFKSGYGTILFFEDEEVITNLQNQFALYKDNFPVWANQSNGMLQYVIWTALETEGLGASLQHYNPLIDEEVKETFSVPSQWKLIAQLPFGTSTAEPGEKPFQPLEERVKFFK